jgi:hypothetical protein
MRTQSISSVEVGEYTGRQVGTMQQQEIIDAFAETALHHLLEEEDDQQRVPILGDHDYPVLCLNEHVDFDEHGNVVVGPPYRLAEKRFDKFLQELFEALAIELYIDHLRMSYPDALGYLSYGGAADYAESAPLMDRVQFDQLALVVADMLMEEGVVSYDFLIGVSDYRIGTRDAARALVWHLVDGDFPESGKTDYTTGIPRNATAHWNFEQHEWLAALDVPYVGYDESLLGQLAKRWR